MTWGLRDYGTASWDGGDPACDHRPPDEAGATKKPSSGQREHAGRFSGPACWKCGARRIDQQLGLEATPAEYIARMVAVFDEVRRVLRSDGTLWLNVGDSYAGSWGAQSRDDGEIAGLSTNQIAAHPRGKTNTGSIPPGSGLKPKDLVGMPWRLAFALQEAGWWLRSDIIWAKPNPMPESVTDRPTKAHEYVFLLTKAPRYYYDADAIREAAEYGRREQPGGAMRPWANLEARAGERTVGGGDPSAGRNARSVWTIATQPYSEAHFATFPEELPRRCILAGTSERGVCPDCGAPWSRVVERTGYNGAGRADATVYTGLAYASPQSAPRGPARNFGEPTSTTTGWAPTCTHAWCPSCAIVVEWKHEQRRQTSTTTGTVRGESSADPGVAEGAVRHRPGVQGATPELQPLREEVPQDVHRLRGGLPVGEQDRHPVRSVLSREVDRSESEDDQGIRDDGEGLHRAVPTGAPDGDEERLRAGAPGGDGRGAGPNALTRRSGGSHQWDQERQPPREPAGVDEDEARWDIEPRAQKDGALSRMRGALPTEGTCRQCGGSVAPLTPVPATVLDIFAGSGTTLMVAVRHGRSAIGIELNPEYAAMARRRIVADAGAEPEQAAELDLTAQLRMPM